MPVSMLTRGCFGMEIDVPSEKGNLGEKRRRHAGGTSRTCRVSLGDMSYEGKARRTLRIQVTTRMVTPSLKLSTQDSGPVV